jgi:hypothetical protein
MQRPFQLHASPRAEQSVRVETIRRERVVSYGWIRRGARIHFIGGRRPPLFNSGTSMLDGT